MALGVALRGLGRAAQLSGLHSTLALRRLDLLLSPWQRLPPSLVYVLFFGGAGLLLIVATFVSWEHGLFPRVRWWLTLLGQTSLFVFLLQAWVFYGLMYFARIPVTDGWPLLFAGILGVITAAAYAWRRYDGNRLLTVGWHRRAAGTGPGTAGRAAIEPARVPEPARPARYMASRL
jgi:hypothetical protein